MMTLYLDAFFSMARTLPPDFGPATARAAFLIAPDGFALAADCASDNRYMAAADRFDPQRAIAQHRDLHRRLSAQLPVLCFAGDPATPDAVFPNNVFATTAGALIVGRMRHAVRQREAERADIRDFFRSMLGYREIDLSAQSHACELTGSLVIDRARGIGYCGLSERCDAQGAQRMHEAFGLRATLVFDLAPGEYHTNVVFMLLAGRVALLSPAGFADPAVPEAIAALYAPHAIQVSPDEQAAFVCNAIALTPDRVWMSRRAEANLVASSRQALQRAGFVIESVELSAIEAAGGSLRCCVSEIF